MKYPLLILAFFWLLALIISYYFTLFLTLLILLFFIGLIIYIWSVYNRFNRYNNSKRFNDSKMWFIIVIICILIIASIRMELYQTSHQSIFTEEIVNCLEGREIGIRGFLKKTPIVDGNLVKFELSPISYLEDEIEYKVDSKEKFLVYLYLVEEDQLEEVYTWKSGMGVSLYGEISEPYSTQNPGNFDYIKYLERSSIYWKINVKDISVIDVSPSSKAIASLNELRDKMSETIDIIFTMEDAGFIKSILLGDRNDLSNELSDYFSLSGLSHLLAISGLHLSIFSLIIYKLLTKLRITRENSAIVTCLFLILYMFLTGATPSVVRATIMAILIFYGYIFNNKFSTMQALGIAFIFMTFYNPYWIFSIGFQLSFIITFFILWGLPLIYRKLPFTNVKVKNILSLVLITQIASFPLVFYYFHQYSFIAFFTNLLLVPIFSSIIFPLSLIVLISGTIYIKIGYFFANILSFLLDVFFCIIEWSAKLSLFQFYGSISSIFWVVVIYLIVVWFLIRRNIKNSFLPFIFRKVIFLCEKAVIIILVIFLLFNNLLNRENCEVTIIDVGQGDSIYLNVSNEINILIDSGGNISFYKEEWQERKDPFDTGKDIVLPYLHYKGVNELDLAILTHEDTDHIGGYLYLVDNIEINTFIVESGFPRTEKGEALYKKIVEKEINLFYIEETTNLKLNKDVQMCFIPVNIIGSESQNDHSFIIVSNIYETRVLFAGDVEKAGEVSIIDKYNIKPIDILKVGHHGSNTSTTDIWLDIIQPKEALISVGKNNRYGFPSDEVIERLNNHKTTIWRTDIEGAILVDINSYRYEISTQ